MTCAGALLHLFGDKSKTQSDAAKANNSHNYKPVEYATPLNKPRQLHSNQFSQEKRKPRTNNGQSNTDQAFFHVFSSCTSLFLRLKAVLIFVSRGVF
jgi:hypothetical protein